MKLTVYLSDGGTLEIEDFQVDTSLDLAEALSDPDVRFAMFALDDESTVMVNVAHIVRIDFD